VLGVQGVVAVAIMTLLGEYVAEEWASSSCDESAGSVSGSKYTDGCSFLADGGFELIKIVPAAVMGAFAAAGFLTGRRRLIWVGFAVAFALLLLAALVEPGDYPWSQGSER